MAQLGPQINYLQITNFAGLNTRIDPRRILPNKDNDGVAEAQVMDNFEITNEGAMITSTGFEEVASLSGTGGIKQIMKWEKSPTEDILLAVHDKEIYEIDETLGTGTEVGAFERAGSVVSAVQYIGTESAKRAILGTNDGVQPVVLYYYTPAYMTTGASTSSIATWQAVTNGNFHILIDGVQVDVWNLNFSGIGSMANVATIIQTAIRAKTGKLETVVWDTDHFVFSSANSTGKSQMTYCFNSSIGGTDISGVTAGEPYLAGTSARGAVMTHKVETDGTITDTTVRGGYIMEEFMGHLFIAIENNLYYSGTHDEMSFASTDSGDKGLISFNEIITGLKNNTDRLVVFTRSNYEGISFTFDDSYALVIPKKDYKRNFGCLAPKTISSVGSNTYYWSNRGVMNLGAEESYNENGIPRPMPLSENIENVLAEANFAKKEGATAIFSPEKQKYYMALPMSTSNVNDTILVYDQHMQAWTSRSGVFVGDFDLFGTKNDLYFGDANSPKIYKFNDSYSYGGYGYTRTWKSKIFTFGAPFRFKKFYKLEIAGSMDTATEFYVTLKVDNHIKKYKIDSSFLIVDSYSEYLGDSLLGDEYFGGNGSEDTRFKRFYAPLDFDREIREGIELEITIENDGEEQPLKIDFLGIKYSIIGDKQVPKSNFVNTQLST